MVRQTIRLLAALAIAAAAVPATAAVLLYRADLSGPAEDPPNASPATGSALVTFDTVENTMRVQLDFSGLQGLTRAAHIHCCTALPGQGSVGVATHLPNFPGFPRDLDGTGVTAGNYDRTFDADVAPFLNPTFIANNGGAAGALSALLAGIDAGKAYLNLHTAAFPGGEIRGFLQAVPEPGTLALLLAGIAGAVGAAGARRGSRHTVLSSSARC